MLCLPRFVNRSIARHGSGPAAPVRKESAGRPILGGLARGAGVLALCLIASSAAAQTITPKLGEQRVVHWLTHMQPGGKGFTGVNATTWDTLNGLAQQNRALFNLAGSGRAWLTVLAVETVTLPVSTCQGLAGQIATGDAAAALRVAYGYTDPTILHVYLLPIGSCTGGGFRYGNARFYNKPLQWLVDYSVGTLVGFNEGSGLKCEGGTCASAAGYDPSSVMASFPVGGDHVSGLSYAGWARVRAGWVDYQDASDGTQDVHFLDTTLEPRVFRVVGNKTYLVEAWPGRGIIIRRVLSPGSVAFAEDLNLDTTERYWLTSGQVARLDGKDIRADVQGPTYWRVTLAPGGTLQPGPTDPPTEPPIPPTCTKNCGPTPPPEVCDGIDNDGDGLIDEGCSTPTCPPNGHPVTVGAFTVWFRGNECTEDLATQPPSIVSKQMPNRILSGVDKAFLSTAPTVDLIPRGLNDEHAIACFSTIKNYFTPRFPNMPVQLIGSDAVRMTQFDPAWRLWTWLDYKVLPSLPGRGAIDLTATFTPEEPALFNSPNCASSFLAVMFASYMPFTTDAKMYFLGQTAADAPETWIPLTFNAPGASIHHVDAAALPVDPAPAENYGYQISYKDNLKSLAWPRYTVPMYCTVTTSQNTVYQISFDRAFSADDEIRFTGFRFQVKTSGEGNPAQDWQYVMRNAVANQQRGFRAHIEVRPYNAATFEAECRAADAAWRAGL